MNFTNPGYPVLGEACESRETNSSEVFSPRIRYDGLCQNARSHGTRKTQLLPRQRENSRIRHISNIVLSLFCRLFQIVDSFSWSKSSFLGAVHMPDNNDISPLDGTKITTEASTWGGTPYELTGANADKGNRGDCSGTTSSIFDAAGFPYEHQDTASFAAYADESGLFRELSATEPKQDGDILLWSHHMSIYSSFSSGAETKYKTTNRVNEKGKTWVQHNDIWTAHHTDGPDYGPSRAEYFGHNPRVFRYQKK